jgi:hypothetical protein
MQQWLLDFREWIGAVLEHWELIIVSGAIPFLLEIAEKLWDKKMSRKWYVVFLIIGLFLAMFAAWREKNTEAKDEREKLEKQTVPHLSGEILRPLALAPGDNGKGTIVTILASIKNTGAPSVARFRSASIVTPSGETFSGRFPTTPSAGVALGDGTGKVVMAFSGNDFLPKLVSYQPIPTGGEPEGFLIAYFDKPRDSLQVAHNKLCLDIYDVIDNKSVICTEFAGGNGEGFLSLQDLQKQGDK